MYPENSSCAIGMVIYHYMLRNNVLYRHFLSIIISFTNLSVLNEDHIHRHFSMRSSGLNIDHCRKSMRSAHKTESLGAESIPYTDEEYN